MRLLVDARPLVDATGGVSRVALGIVSALIEQAGDMEIALATTGVHKPDLPPVTRNLPPVRQIHLHVPNKLWSAACMLDAMSLDREIEKRVGKIDAIFLPNIGFVGSLRRPYILLLHDLSFLIEPQWFSPRMQLWHHAVHAKQLIKNATSLLSVSETTKRDAMRLLNIPEKRITVIPLGSTLPIPSVTCHQPPVTSPYVLAFAGNARKNAATAVAAVNELRRDPQFANVELILIGSVKRNVIPTIAEGSSNWKFNAKISRQARNDRSFIHLISHPSDSELACLYANAATLLYPSWYEGYGLPLHEAASFGTPRVASTAGALPETAPRGTIFADPAKPRHWVEAIRIALTLGRQPPTHNPAENWQKASKILRDALSKMT